MKLYVSIEGKPAVIVGYAPGPKAIVIGLERYPVAVSLDKCILPRLPKKLERRARAIARAETKAAQRRIIEQSHLDA